MKKLHGPLAKLQETRARFDATVGKAQAEARDLLLALRGKLGLTQVEFAQRLGIHPVYLCKLETGAALPGMGLMLALRDLLASIEKEESSCPT